MIAIRRVTDFSSFLVLPSFSTSLRNNYLRLDETRYSFALSFAFDERHRLGRNEELDYTVVFQVRRRHSLGDYSERSIESRRIRRSSDTGVYRRFWTRARKSRRQKLRSHHVPAQRNQKEKKDVRKYGRETFRPRRDRWTVNKIIPRSNPKTENPIRQRNRVLDGKRPPSRGSPFFLESLAKKFPGIKSPCGDAR